MSEAAALIIGFGVIAYTLVKITQLVVKEENIINKGIYVLSSLFLVLMEWSAYGIANKAAFNNAKLAYMASLFITILVFIGLTALFIEQVLRIHSDNGDDLDGL